MRTFRGRIIIFGLLFSLCYCQDTPNDYSVDDDYSEPGAPTEPCTCVPYYQCENGKIVDDGSGIIDPRKKPQEEELRLDEKYVPPACGPYHVCCSEPEDHAVKPYEHRCGMRNANGINSRILTADDKGEAEFGEWPWQAAILKNEGKNKVFKCGGTLIDEFHIITVAHCVDSFLEKPSQLTVRLGEWDTQSESEFMPHEDFTVDSIIMHPEYRKNNLHNDIAILRVDKEVIFKGHIDTACLPRDEDDFVGHDCVVTGWGTDAYKSGRYSNIMKEVIMPVISNEECQDKLRKTRLGRYFKLHNGFMCAGGEENKDSCKGDGGGPLACYREQDYSYTVAGLVSWGIDCGKADVPGVYINLKKYIDWIASQTGKNVENYWSKPA